jgi:hypothetical protein
MRPGDRDAELFYRDLFVYDPHRQAELFYRSLVGFPRASARPSTGAEHQEQAPAPVFTHFALLDHFLGVTHGSTDDDRLAAEGVVLDPSKINLPHDADPIVQLAVDAALAGPGVSAEIKALRFAIAKLEWRDGTAKVTYGGNRLISPRADEAAVNTGASALTGRRDVETWEAVSVGKLAFMYAAFQLRFDVMAMAARNAREARAGRAKLWTTPAELLAGVTAIWASRQARSGPRRVIRAANPRLELHGRVVLRDGTPIGLKLTPGSARTTSGAPQLDQIFDFMRQASTGKWFVMFKGEQMFGVWTADGMRALQARLHKYGDDDRFALELTTTELASLSFFDLLFMMVNWSHNHASSIILERIGFMYVNSLLWQSGLFDPAGPGGFFMARNYGPGRHTEHWDVNGNRRPGLLVPGQPRFTPDKGGPAQISAGLSAAIGVKFMALLYRGWLTSAMSSWYMRTLLDRIGQPPRVVGAGHSDRSPLADAFGAPSSTVFEHVYSKIGIGSRRTDDKKNISDCALLYRKDPKTIFAVCCLDSHGSPPLASLVKRVMDLL